MFTFIVARRVADRTHTLFGGTINVQLDRRHIESGSGNDSETGKLLYVRHHDKNGCRNDIRHGKLYTSTSLSSLLLTVQVQYLYCEPLCCSVFVSVSVQS